MFSFVSGGDLYTDACLVFRNHGIIESGDVNAFFLHTGGVNLRKFGIIQHHGADSTLCRLDVKSGGSHFLAEVINVFY